MNKVMTYQDWVGSSDYWQRLYDTYGADSETDLETHDINKQDIWNLYREYQIEIMNKGE